MVFIVQIALTGTWMHRFIIELVRERLLDVKLYKVPSGEGEQADGAPGVVALNEVYGTDERTNH